MAADERLSYSANVLRCGSGEIVFGVKIVRLEDKKPTRSRPIGGSIYYDNDYTLDPVEIL
jgi:hypothetical protein